MTSGKQESRYVFRLSGSNSSNLILAGKILAEAAAIYDGKNVTRWQSYGPEARSSVSRSDVIISNGMIESPKAEIVDLLLAFTQEACDKYHKDVKKGGIILVDADYVARVPVGKYTTCALSITRIAEREVREISVTNIVALGIISASTAAISREAIRSAILLRVPKGVEGLYLRAFRIGADAVQKIKNVPCQRRKRRLIVHQF